MKKTKAKGQQFELAAKISNSLEFPLDTLVNAPVIHLVGKDRLDIEGCKGILAYTDNEMILNMGIYNFTVRGANLILKTLSKSSVIVSGEFLSFHLAERGGV